jgi:hypothetical protein
MKISCIPPRASRERFSQIIFLARQSTLHLRSSYASANGRYHPLRGDGFLLNYLWEIRPIQLLERFHDVVV